MTLLADATPPRTIRDRGGATWTLPRSGRRSPPTSQCSAIPADIRTVGALVARIVQACTNGLNVHPATTPQSRTPADPAYWWRDSGAGAGSQTTARRAGEAAARNDAHPRAGGAFSDAFARYVQEERVLTLGQAIQRMTSFAATQFRLHDPGAIRAGVHGTMIGARPGRALFGRARMVAGAKS